MLDRMNEKSLVHTDHDKIRVNNIINSTNSKTQKIFNRFMIGVGEEDKSMKPFLKQESTAFLKEIEDCLIKICNTENEYSFKSRVVILSAPKSPPSGSPCQQAHTDITCQQAHTDITCVRLVPLSAKRKNEGLIVIVAFDDGAYVNIYKEYKQKPLYRYLILILLLSYSNLPDLS